MQRRHHRHAQEGFGKAKTAKYGHFFDATPYDLVLDVVCIIIIYRALSHTPFTVTSHALFGTTNDRTLIHFVARESPPV